MMQKETTSLAIRWDAPADIMMTVQAEGAAGIVEKRGHILSGTLLTGMRPSELNVEKQYKGQQSLKVNYM